MKTITVITLLTLLSCTPPSSLTTPRGVDLKITWSDNKWVYFKTEDCLSDSVCNSTKAWDYRIRSHGEAYFVNDFFILEKQFYNFYTKKY